MHLFGAFCERIGDFFRVQNLIANHVINLVEDHQIVFAAVNLFAAEIPALLAKLDVLRVRIGAADFDEAATHGANFEFIVTQHFRGVQFAIMP